MDVKIGVVGLADFNRSLRKLDKEAPKGLRLAFNGAADLLIDRTRPGIPRKSGAARSSLRASSTRTSARVRVGGPKAPYYPWLDFGGQGRIKGRPVSRPYIEGGRYLYPTLRIIRPDIEKLLAGSLADVARSAGIEVR